MPDLVIKPTAGAGNKLILQDQGGGALLTSATSGATLADGIALGTPASGTLTGCTFNSGQVLKVACVHEYSGFETVAASADHYWTKTIIDAGKQVYEGMIVGLHTRPTDLVVNVCKEKKLTNMRSSTADIVTKLIKPVELSLEESLDIISEEELIEITPKHLRLRKRILPTTERLRYEKNTSKSTISSK